MGRTAAQDVGTWPAYCSNSIVVGSEVDTTVRRRAPPRLPAAPSHSSVTSRDQTTPPDQTASSWQQQVRCDVIRSRDPTANDSKSAEKNPR